MKIEIDDILLREAVINKFADRIVEILINGDDSISWDKKDEHRRRQTQKILDKINWKNCAPELSSIIIKKFFNKILDEKN